jgi:TetR/AcrR family transcriptional repressor of nem operon
MAEAVAAALADSGARFDRRLAGLDPQAALGEWIDRYVSVRHRDAPARGCALTALSAEAARASAPVREALADGVELMIARLAGRLDDAGVAEPETLAASLLAEAVGAVTLARVLGPGAASDALLAGTRAALRNRAGLPA